MKTALFLICISPDYLSYVIPACAGMTERKNVTRLPCDRHHGDKPD